MLWLPLPLQSAAHSLGCAGLPLRLRLHQSLVRSGSPASLGGWQVM
jgi:hypothetical protein